MWPAAAAMRRAGGPMERVRQITCPILAIHGSHDPSPAAGLPFPVVRLDRYGHTPWRERFASEGFYRVLAEIAGK